jgi:hypothetical protein
MFAERLLKIPGRYYRQNKTIRAMANVLGARLYKPSHLKVIWLDRLDRRFDITDSNTHTQNALRWLFNAQDQTKTGGISAGYSFVLGWLPPYPEISGYMIPTLFDMRDSSHNTISDECAERAIRIAKWLVGIQLENGAFKAVLPGEQSSILTRAIFREAQPLIFDTGQALLGLLRAYEETKIAGFLQSSILAGNWISESQNQDGAWSDNVYNGFCQTYHTLVAWPLIKLWKITQIEKYRNSGIKTLEWALTKQTPQGWFRDNAFTPDARPYTHTIAYTAQGFLESGILLNDKRYLNAAKKTAEALLKLYLNSNVNPYKGRINGSLAGAYNENWQSPDRYSCLTGNAQISSLWSRLAMIDRDPKLLDGAVRMNNYLKGLQNRTSPNKGIAGGIKGSHPIYGDYMGFCYPSWACKFFIDALIAESAALSILGKPD